MDIVDTHQHTIPVIQKEMAKNPAFLQKKIDDDNMNYPVKAFTAEIDAAATLLVVGHARHDRSVR